MSETPVLHMKGIVKSFSGVVVLDHVDFSVRRGEVHALMGENGAGKSTLMKILAGIYTKDAGEIAMDGREIAIKSPNDPTRAGIAFVHQHPSLVPMFDVARNIFLGREPLVGGAIDWKKMHSETESLLAGIGASIPVRRQAADLTVAERQMISIARALSLSPRVIAFDEPTAPLSFKEVDRLFECIASLTARQVTVIYISHRMDEIFNISERITVLRNGKTVDSVATADTAPSDIIRAMLGADVSFTPKTLHGEKAETVLETSGLTTEQLPEPLSLSLRKGEVLGLFGLVGAGRTEVARALFGVDRPLGGGIRMNGGDIPAPTPAAMMEQGCALVPEDRHSQGLVMDMTIKDNIGLANMSRFSLGPFIRKAVERSSVLGLAKRLAVKARSIDAPASQLSGGNQQKVVLAKWLCREPKVLILDEPTVGIDVGTKSEIYRLVNDLAASGLGVIFISSEPEEIFRVADRILVMYRRKVVAEFQAGDTDINELMAHATGAKSAV